MQSKSVSQMDTIHYIVYLLCVRCTWYFRLLNLFFHSHFVGVNIEMFLFGVKFRHGMFVDVLFDEEKESERGMKTAERKRWKTSEKKENKWTHARQ